MAQIELNRDTSLEAVPQHVTGLSIGEYLIRRLQDYGIGHVFGIPGDYILQFYSMLDRSPLEIVTTTREDCAGFAADAYARVHGMGAACVTYCVGGLSLCNSVAGAYAEKSPVVVITGSPGLKERHNNPLLHHRVRDFRTQFDVFEKLCIACTELNDPLIAFHEIDRVLHAAARYKRPVYIEIPRDMVGVVPEMPHRFEQTQLVSDPEVLAEAVAEAERWLNTCQRPAIVGGVEIHRFGLQDDLLALAEGSQIPITTTMLGKSIIPEVHPLFVGLYEGAMGNSEVTRFVEQSDCLLLLGTFMTDINLGIYTANLDPGKCIYATSEQLRIRHHHFHNVLLSDFMRELAARRPLPPRRPIPKIQNLASEKFVLAPDEPIRISRLMARLNEQLDDETIVIADIGDALFAATELVIRGRTEFISPAYYTSMGFSIPAALGAQVARPDLRAVVIVGDGAFQMTGAELSSLIRRKLPTIVIVLDNGGYGTERFLHPGHFAFNDIQPWAYDRLPEVYGGGTGYRVTSEKEFDAALDQAWADTSGVSLIQVKLDPADHSTALARLTDKLSKRV
ncbi:MAG TPA: thiamine pyrophosphate-dependent enzyme [Pirellulales bacterium]|jgi:indolepyruvate decarboxylase|nr:thiamine pyrophosphate-dependent enzyme [Pirellulales bacterium]